MDIGLRTFLIATAIAFPVIALIAFVIILFKIKQKRKEKLPWTPPRASISLVIIPLAGDCQMMDYKGKEALLTYF